MIVMERMGWTYDQYLEQPSDVVDLIVSKISLESKLAQDGRK